MEALVNDTTPTFTTSEIFPETIQIKSPFYMRLVVAFIAAALLIAGAVVLLDGFGAFKQAPTAVNSTIPTAPIAKEQTTKVGFVVNGTWNKIETPSGAVLYSRCSPYIKAIRWTIDPAGNLSTSDDSSCKPS